MRTILVADEDRNTVSMYEHALRQKGFYVWTARTGRECLEQFRRHRPDLLIVAWLLPGIDGREVIRQVIHDAEADLCPVIVLATRDDGDLPDDLAGQGVSDSFVKPVSLDSVVRRVCELARQPAVCVPGPIGY